MESPAIVIGENIVRDVAKLQLTDGDILLLRLPDKADRADATLVMRAMREWTRSHGFSQIRLLCVMGDTAIEQLDEVRMLQYGWVRAKKGYQPWRS